MDAPAKKYQELLAKEANISYGMLMCRLVKTSMIVYFRNQDIPTTIFMRMILTFR